MLRGYFKFVLLVVAVQIIGVGSADAAFVCIESDFVGTLSDASSDASPATLLPEIVFDLSPTVLVPLEPRLVRVKCIVADVALLALVDVASESLQPCIGGLSPVSSSYHSPMVDVQTPPPRMQG